MKKRTILSIAVFLSLLAALPVWATDYEATIVRQFPSPGPQPTGVAWKDSLLYVCDRAADSIWVYRIYDTTQVIVSRYACPFADPFGMSFINGDLYICGPYCVYRLDSTMAIADSCDPPEIWNLNNFFSGVTYDSSEIWISDCAGYSSYCYTVDMGSCHARGRWCSGGGCEPIGLTWARGNFWVCENNSNIVKEVEPVYGDWIGGYLGPGCQPGGLCYDGFYFWQTDTVNKAVYQLDVHTTGIGDFPHRREFLPTVYLGEAFPNPFNGEVTISYRIPKNSTARVSVYNVLGQEILLLPNIGRSASSGTVSWDGSNALGEPTGTGLYFFVLEADGQRVISKVMLVR